MDKRARVSLSTSGGHPNLPGVFDKPEGVSLLAVSS